MKYNIKIVFFIIILFSFGICSPWVGKGFADQQEVEIKTVPENQLFSLENLAPGQVEEKDIIVQNIGKQDFHYQTFVKYKLGSKQLYQMLDLTIMTNDGEILFQGKLKDFSSLKGRTIEKNKDERLTIKIGLPSEAGNEFQSLDCVVDFQFLADSEPAIANTNSNTITNSNSNVSNDNSSLRPDLPNTATNIYNYIAAGTFLIVIGFLLNLYFTKRQKFEKID